MVRLQKKLQNQVQEKNFCVPPLQAMAIVTFKKVCTPIGSANWGQSLATINSSDRLSCTTQSQSQGQKY